MEINATRKPKAPAAFHSQAFRCFRSAMAPTMLPVETTIATKIRNDKNDSSESCVTTSFNTSTSHQTKGISL